MSAINELFDKLDDWRNLPAYQLERRADIFFAMYLPDIVAAKFGWQIQSILPEFPIRIELVNRHRITNQSVKFDYLLRLEQQPHFALLELKTDMSSRGAKQEEYLKDACSKGMHELVKGILEINSVTRAKGKYKFLLDKLQIMGLVRFQDKYEPVTTLPKEITFAYIQMNNSDQKPYIISFEEAALIIEKRDDELGLRFAKSLRAWARQTAGGVA